MEHLKQQALLPLDEAVAQQKGDEWHDRAYEERWPTDDDWRRDIDRVCRILWPHARGTDEEPCLYDFAEEVLSNSIKTGLSLEEQALEEIKHIEMLLLEENSPRVSDTRN